MHPLTAAPALGTMTLETGAMQRLKTERPRKILLEMGLCSMVPRTGALIPSAPRTSLNLGIFSNGNPTNFKGGFFNGGFQTGAYQLFPLNTWQQMTVTWDGTYVKTYINGALVDTADLSGQTSSSVSNNYYRIGCRWDFAEFVLGEIGELIVYPRALSGGEISSHYTATLPTY